MGEPGVRHLTKIPYGSAAKGLRPHLGTHCPWRSTVHQRRWRELSAVGEGRTDQRDTSAGLGCPPPHPRMVTSGPQPPESGAVPAEVAAGTSGHPETGQGAPLTTKRCLLSYLPFTHHEKHTCIFNKYNSVK